MAYDLLVRHSALRRHVKFGTIHFRCPAGRVFVGMVGRGILRCAITWGLPYQLLTLLDALRINNHIYYSNNKFPDYEMKLVEI